MLKRFLTLFTIAALFAGSASASTYRLVLQSGHEDLPVALHWHNNTDTVVSVGEDGRLIVTDPSDHQVLHRFRVTNEQVHDLALDPSSEKAAVLTRRGDGFAVSVWDWSDEELVYDYNLDSEPLFVSWSARGRYLIIGNLGDPTIIVLEGRSGRRLSYLQRLPSLYNAGYIGSTETILMTYASSGSIRYWDIRSSALKLSAETITSLEDPTVLQTGNKASMFGYRNETLYLVNRQTGAVQDRIDIPGLVDVSVDPLTGDIEALSSNLAGSQLHRFNATSEIFEPRDPLEPEEDEEGNIIEGPGYHPVSLDPVLKPVKVLRRLGVTYLMGENGELISDTGTYFAEVINDRVWRPDSLAFAGDSIYLSNGGTVQRFTSPFFSADSRGNTDDLEGLLRDEIDLGSTAQDSGLLALDGDRLVHWDKASTANDNGYRIFSFQDEVLATVPVDGSIQKLEMVDESRLLSVDRSGAVVIRSIEDGRILNSYSALGILDAAFDTEGDYVLTGRSSAGRVGTPLEQVDLRTGESIPIADSRFMIYRTIHSEDGIYSIGVDRSGGSSETIILNHTAGNPERSRTILSVDEEHLSAALLPHPDGRGVFVSLGDDILKIDGNRKTVYDWEEPVKEFGYRGSILYGIDIDGALVMWNANGGEALMRVYFFDDGGWIAMPPDGERIWASPGAIENVVLYRDGRPVDPRRVSYSRIGDSSSGS